MRLQLRAKESKLTLKVKIMVYFRALVGNGQIQTERRGLLSPTEVMPHWKWYELGNKTSHNYLYFGHVQCIEIREEKCITI